MGASDTVAGALFAGCKEQGLYTPTRARAQRNRCHYL